MGWKIYMLFRTERFKEPKKTQAIFSCMWYNAPGPARIKDNYLNLAQAYLTLPLAASPTPPAPSVSPKKKLRIQSIGSNFNCRSIKT